MKLTSEHYYQAALERMEQARFLYHKGNCYALAMYTGGVAVECMLRAFKLKKQWSLEEKHDLTLLFGVSGIANLAHDVMPDKDKLDELLNAMKGAVTLVSFVWANDYRYASEDRLRAHLKLLKLHKGIKGDVLKANALRLINASQIVIDRGKHLWMHSEKN